MLEQLTPVAAVDPKSTVVAPVVVEKPDPEIKTIVPPAADPAEGEMLVTVGVTVDADAGGTAGISTTAIEPNKSIKTALNQLHTRLIRSSNSSIHPRTDNYLAELYYTHNSDFYYFYVQFEINQS